MTYVDKLYTEVCQRPEPDRLLGAVTTYGKPLSSDRVPDHRTTHIVMLPTKPLVAYDRNAPSNYVAAFKYRIMLPPNPWNPGEALQICQSRAIPDLVSKVGRYTVTIDADSISSWLAVRPYGQARRSQISRAMWRFTSPSGTIDVPRALTRCFVEGHLKDEFYPYDPEGPNKPPRLILARNDLGKALYGVLFEPLNTKFFQLD